jgi:non-homologous end joining protein Ku
MARAFWKGVISFGLVAIPVKMYVGTGSESLSFHLLHKKCLTRPKQVLNCEKDSEYFGIKDTVRGYEVSKDRYVVLAAAELEMAVSLVKAMAKTFKPEEYRDEYRAALKKVVDAKMKGEKITAPAPPKLEMGDLMESLRVSIRAAKKEPVAVAR